MKWVNGFLTLVVAGLWLLPQTGMAAKPNPEECYFYDDVGDVSIVEVYSATCNQSLSNTRNLLGRGLFNRELEFAESDGGICYYYAMIGDGTWILEGVIYIGTSVQGECEPDFTLSINDALVPVRECEFAIRNLASFLDALPDCE